jgi:hypothetical protein
MRAPTAGARAEAGTVAVGAVQARRRRAREGAEGRRATEGVEVSLNDVSIRTKPMTAEEKTPDVFISYASEQRADVALPLATLLTALGVTVWLDQFELKLGDSLRRKIDEGLATCRHGVIVLSHAFFAKHYTRRELDGLAQREVEGEKVILPVWFDVNEHDVRTVSPTLADRIAVRWADGIHVVAAKIMEVVRPDLLEAITQEFTGQELPRVTSGKQLAAIVGGAHFSYLESDELRDEAEVELIGGFIQELRDWGDIWNDLEPIDHIRTGFQLTERLREIESAGWTVYGSRENGKRRMMGVDGEWEWSNVAVIRGKPAKVLKTDSGFVVMRLPDAEVSER